MIALAAIDPAKLTSAQKCALARAANRNIKLCRRRGYWGSPPNRVSLAVAEDLIGRGLARVDRSWPEPRLVLTGTGMQLAGVLEERARRKAGLDDAEHFTWGKRA
jgi:hypothetical protein